MSFSPEVATMDTLSKLLDLKLKTLHDKMDKVCSLSTEVPGLKKEIELLKVENKALSDKVEKLENYSRRNNIRLYNIREKNDENLDEFLVQMMNHYLNSSNRQFTDRTFEAVHRLGKPKKDQTRIVIARFISYKDKQHLLKVQQQIRQCEGIGISDDFSAAIEERRKKLFPICKAIRIQKKKETGNVASSVYLKMDKLMLDGKLYTFDN